MTGCCWAGGQLWKGRGPHRALSGHGPANCGAPASPDGSPRVMPHQHAEEGLTPTPAAQAPRVPGGAGQEGNGNVPKSAALHSVPGGPGCAFPGASVPRARMQVFDTPRARKTHGPARSPRSRDTRESASAFATLCQHRPHPSLVPESSPLPQGTCTYIIFQNLFLGPLRPQLWMLAWSEIPNGKLGF